MKKLDQNLLNQNLLNQITRIKTDVSQTVLEKLEKNFDQQFRQSDDNSDILCSNLYSYCATELKLKNTQKKILLITFLLAKKRDTPSLNAIAGMTATYKKILKAETLEALQHFLEYEKFTPSDSLKDMDLNALTTKFKETYKNNGSIFRDNAEPEYVRGIYAKIINTNSFTNDAKKKFLQIACQAQSKGDAEVYLADGKYTQIKNMAKPLLPKLAEASLKSPLQNTLPSNTYPVKTVASVGLAFLVLGGITLSMACFPQSAQFFAPLAKALAYLGQGHAQAAYIGTGVVSTLFGAGLLAKAISNSEDSLAKQTIAYLNGNQLIKK